MDSILHFNEISDYANTMNLNVENRYSDFLIYNYQTLHPDACSELRPFRQNYFEITLELSKGCHFTVDRFELVPTENRLTLISPHRLQKYGGQSTSGSSHKGFGIFFKPEFIGTITGNNRFIRDFSYFSHLNAPHISLKKEETDVYEDLVQNIFSEYEANSSHSREIIQSYLNILFLKAKENYRVPEPENPQKQNGRDREIFEQFSSLVQQQFLELRSVTDYAGRMHLSPKHLSETVKKVSGQSALLHIHKAQINHAKALLRQTPKTVTEIAYDLNFENPEYFSVFFKRVSGESPSQFRSS
jgi:AraC family transcriptional regulator, transcriptional activator of pobA